MFSTPMAPNKASVPPKANPQEGTYRMAGSTALLDPVSIFRSVWMSKRQILLATLLGLSVAALVAFSTPKKYTANSQILADPRDIKVVQNEVTPNGLPSEATLALIESQISVIYSNDLLGRVIRSQNLTDDNEFNGQSTSSLSQLFSGLTSIFGSGEADENKTFLLTLGNLRQALNVVRDAKSFVINVSVTTQDPEKSARLSRTIADTFIAQLGRQQADTARQASDALSSRLSQLRQDVTTAERAVEQYKAKNQLVGVGGRLVDDDYITRVNDQLSRGRADVTSLRVKADQMKQASVDDVVKGTLPEELTSETLTRLRSTYSDLAQQVAVLSSTLGPRHPQLIAAQQALRSARSAIQDELNRIVAGAQTELARAEQTNEDLARQLDTLKTKQVATSESFVKLRELEREVDASRAVYEAFLLRARETGEQETLNTANVHVISEATPPLKPSSLSRRILILIGGILGFLAGIALAAGSAVATQLGGLFAPKDDYPVAPSGYLAPPVIVPAKAADERNFSERNRPFESAGIANGEHEDQGRPAASFDDDDRAHHPLPSDEALTSVADGEQAEENADTRRASESGANAFTLPGDANDVRHTSRRSLRERVRTIAAERGLDTRSGDGEDQDVTRLQNDIAAVKKQIADLRTRRVPG